MSLERKFHRVTACRIVGVGTDIWMSSTPGSPATPCPKPVQVHLEQVKKFLLFLCSSLCQIPLVLPLGTTGRFVWTTTDSSLLSVKTSFGAGIEAMVEQELLDCFDVKGGREGSSCVWRWGARQEVALAISALLSKKTMCYFLAITSNSVVRCG